MMIGITVTSMGLTFDGLAWLRSNIPVYKKRYIMLTKVRQLALAPSVDEWISLPCRLRFVPLLVQVIQAAYLCIF